jgi:RNA polymerase sigma-70 factor (ECF subfamily)
VRQWGGLVQSAARRYGLLGAEQAELTQDVRIRLWRALGRTSENPRSIGSSYVYQAVMSAAIDLLRRRRLERSGRTISIDEIPDRMAAPPPRLGNEAELDAALERALATLAPDRRGVVRMHLDGKHRNEIAGMLGWSEARTRNLVYRGLDDLKRALQHADSGHKGGRAV